MAKQKKNTPPPAKKKPVTKTASEKPSSGGSTITEADIKRRKEEVKLLQKKQELEQKLLDIETKKSKLSDKSSDYEKKAKKFQEEELKIRKELEELDKKKEKRQKTHKKNEEESYDKFTDTKAAYEELTRLSQTMIISQEFSSKEAKEYLKYQDKTHTLLAGMRKILTENFEAEAQGVRLGKEWIGIRTRGVDLAQDLDDLIQDGLDQADDAIKGEYTKIDTLRVQKELRRMDLYYEFNKGKMGKIAIDQYKTMRDLLQQTLDRAKALDESLQETANDAKRVNGALDALLELDLAGAVRNYFSFDDIKKDIKEKIGKSLVDSIRIVRGEYGLVGGIKQFGKNLLDIGKMIPRIAGAAGLGLMIGGIGLITKMMHGFVDMLMQADQDIADMGKEFAISRKEAGELHKNAARMSTEMNIVGINTKEVVEGIKAATEAFGDLDVAGQLSAGNKEMETFVKQSTILSKQFGLSGQEIGAIHDLATITGKPMDVLVNESVQLGKGAMNAKQTMKVLAGIPPTIAVAFKGTTKELIAAAQKAKMLGTDLKAIATSGRGMLEIEQSLGDEMEARVLTGKNINLDAARTYALNGDIFNLQEEMLKQAGSLKDFQKMGPIQQESMAKAMNMSVEEMTKMLTNAQKLKDAHIEAADAARFAEMDAKQLADEASKTNDKTRKDYIQQLAAEKTSASIKEKMADLLEKIKAKFAPIVEKILDMAHGLFDSGKAASGIDSIIKKIDFEKIFKGIMDALPSIVAGVKHFIEKLPDIIKMVTGLAEKFASFASFINPSVMGIGLLGLKFAGPITGMVKLGSAAVEFGKNMAGAAKTAGDVAKGVSAVADTTKTLGEGAKTVKATADAAKGISSVAGAAGAASSAIPQRNPIASFINDIDPTRLLAFAAALVLMASALWITAKALQEFASVEWGAMAKAAVALLGLIGLSYLLADGSAQMIIGAAALVVMSAGLYVMGAALEKFTKVNWEDLAKAGAAIVGFSAIMFGLGSLMFTGVGALLFAAGAAALIVLGGALAIFSLGMLAFGSAVKTMNGIDFAKFGENLSNGLYNLAQAISKISMGDLIWSFAKLGIAMAMLPIDAIKSMGQLANAEMGKAGQNLVLGINSLMGINTQINWSGLEDTFEDLEDALDELDLDGIKAFSELGNTAIKDAGNNLVAGLNSFANINADAAIKAIDPMENVFDSLEDALDELNYEDLKNFAQVDWSKFPAAGTSIAAFMSSVGNTGSASLEGLKSLVYFINNMQVSKITEMASGMQKLSESLMSLTASLEKINAEKLQKVASVSTSNTESGPGFFGSIGSMFSGGGSSSSTSVADGGGEGRTDMSKVEQKLDTLINLFNQAASQPTVIKFGDKVVDQIKTELNFKKAYTIGVDNTYGRAIQS